MVQRDGEARIARPSLLTSFGAFGFSAIPLQAEGGTNMPHEIQTEEEKSKRGLKRSAKVFSAMAIACNEILLCTVEELMCDTMVQAQTP